MRSTELTFAKPDVISKPPSTCLVNAIKRRERKTIFLHGVPQVTSCCSEHLFHARLSNPVAKFQLFGILRIPPCNVVDNNEFVGGQAGTASRLCRLVSTQGDEFTLAGCVTALSSPVSFRGSTLNDALSFFFLERSSSSLESVPEGASMGGPQ